MSRKHNAQHHRSNSNYPERLRARGLTSAGARMTDYIGCGIGPSASAAQRQNVSAIKRGAPTPVQSESEVA